MAEFWYNIEEFKWSKDENQFQAEAVNLRYPGYMMGFPNQGQQFFIINRKSCNFRRFRLKNETPDNWLFESEDTIQCLIKKNKES